MRTDGIAGVA